MVAVELHASHLLALLWVVPDAGQPQWLPSSRIVFVTSLG